MDSHVYIANTVGVKTRFYVSNMSSGLNWLAVNKSFHDQLRRGRLIYDAELHIFHAWCIAGNKDPIVDKHHHWIGVKSRLNNWPRGDFGQKKKWQSHEKIYCGWLIDCLHSEAMEVALLVNTNWSEH